MLKQATAENDRLTAENHRLMAEVAALRAGVLSDAVALPTTAKEVAFGNIDVTTASVCTASEPEIERSGEFDIDRIYRLGFNPSAANYRAAP
mmetsp:Transcript_19939/g.60691  ORF Transcript_19939/g.60691 Transcript_19939/m.60691 type:complete len:92 (+) Transcript_19939:86-361(+)